MKTDLIQRIIVAEWKMFSAVKNTGGPAPCHDKRDTFEVMRTSQLTCWTVPILQSYLQDLGNAEKLGHNLMTEKYARMMESTFPQEFNKVRHTLPTLSQEVHDIVEEIIDVHVQWAKDAAKAYPYLLQKGRPITSSEDNEYQTSIETYLRGELFTYSISTLKLLRDHVNKSRQDERNLVMAELLTTAKQFGYASLEKANETLEKRASLP